MNGVGVGSSPGSRIVEAMIRADAYFLSDELRNEGANEVANTRMGLLLCFFASWGTLTYLPFMFSTWPLGISVVSTLLVVGTIALPFVLRQTRAIRHLGQIVCGILAVGSIASISTSAGRAVGFLPFLPILPIAGLLVRGRRGAILWGVVALGIGAFGLALIAVDAKPYDGFEPATITVQYVIGILCVIGVGGMAQLFESFWNRTAIEVADRAQAELRAREERNRSLLEYATEGVAVVDSDAVIQFASPAAERIVGVEPGGSIGRRLRDFTNPEDLKTAYPVWEETLANPARVASRQLRTVPGGNADPPEEPRILEVTLSNRLANPAVDGVIVRLRDITDLSNAEANYESLVEHSLQGIAVLCDGAIVYANEALANLFDTSQSEILARAGPDGLTFVHRDDRDRVTNAFASPDDQTSGPGEVRIMRGDGRWRWLQLRFATANWEGRPAHQIACADITAQKELAESQERENERLEAAIAERTRELEASQERLVAQERMAAVGTLAAGIAHQINNPIGAILTSADFAILMQEEEGGEKIRSDALDDIRAQAIRCGKIVRSVLQFSRSEATEKWASDLIIVLRAAVDVTSRYAGDRGATIEVSISPEASGRTALMNPIELEQVFVNLIRNAIESQPKGAVVQISVRLQEDDIEVVIEDDGPGISDDHARHVFDPFYTTRLREGGTGLGLSVAHGIVEDHGGSMWLATRRGPDSDDEPEAPADSQGARFHVRLPLQAQESGVAT